MYYTTAEHYAMNFTGYTLHWIHMLNPVMITLIKWLSSICTVCFTFSFAVIYIMGLLSGRVTNNRLRISFIC